MVNDISVLNEWWLVSMPIPMEPQRQAIGNLIDLKSHCEGSPLSATADQTSSLPSFTFTLFPPLGGQVHVTFALWWIEGYYSKDNTGTSIKVDLNFA